MNYDEESTNQQVKNAQKPELQNNEALGFYICYLFECSKPDGFKCHFSAHNYYISATAKNINVFNRPLKNLILKDLPSVAQESDLHQNSELSSDTSSMANTTVTNDLSSSKPIVKNSDSEEEHLISGCRHEQFKCSSINECIPIYQFCDGVVQCSDQSDEARCSDEGFDRRIPPFIKVDSQQTSTTTSTSIADDHNTSSRTNTEQSMIINTVANNTDQVQSKATEVSIGDVHRYNVENFVAIEADKTSDEIDMTKVESVVVNPPHYSKIINGHHTVDNHQSLNGKHPWFNSHIASIKIKQEVSLDIILSQRW